MGIMIGGEVLFFDAAANFSTPVMKMGGGRNGKFSISPSNKKFLAFYVPGVKGAPSMCKLYQYPNVNGQPIGCKSFFQADQVEMLWNKKGTDLLLLTSTEIDQTGASYYGKQALHFMSTNGDSYSVQLSKEGPIHAVEWSPKSNEFCVVYGYMPANATIFNVKCDAVHTFESGPRNAVYYNSFGNILLLAGFGNLRGLIEVWDMTKRKQITTIQAPDSTQLEWHPSGNRFATATTAPRLRMSNGFKVWHYSGALLHETIWPTPAELYEIKWQRFADGVFPEPTITAEKVEGIKSSVPQASAQVYRPPNVRLGLTADDTPKIPGLYPTSTKPTDKKSGNKRRDYWSKKKKSENSNAEESGSGATTDEREKKPQSAPAGVSGGSSGGGNNGNNSFKNNSTNTNNGYNKQNTRRPNSTRERDTRDPNRPFSRGPSDSDANASPKVNNSDRDGGDRSEQSSQRQSAENRSGRRGANRTGGNFSKTTGDPEKDKRMKTIQKKLQDISKLKGRQNHGEQLEVNQLTKISTEATLMAELKQLSLQ
jgi:translation initiation factor 2A